MPFYFSTRTWVGVILSIVSVSRNLTMRKYGDIIYSYIIKLKEGIYDGIKAFGQKNMVSNANDAR